MRAVLNFGILISCLLYASCAELLPTKDDCGTTSAGRLQLPWTVFFEYEGDGPATDCMGFLINKNNILTTQKCAKPDNAVLKKVKLGYFDTTSVPCPDKNTLSDTCNIYAQDLSPAQILVTGGESASYADLALIRLESAADYTEAVGSVCLPFVNDEYVPTTTSGEQLVVGGWPKNVTDGRFHIYRTAFLIERMPEDECFEKFNIKLHPSEYCLKTTEFLGLFGTPVMNKVGDHWYAEGILLAGPGGRDYPQLYVELARYKEWIYENLKA